MCRFNQRLGLPVVAITVALLTAVTLYAQTPSEVSIADQPGLPISAVPQPLPTPEAVGDSLMAHRRYQAAIEAYKTVPQPSAAVWNKMGIAYQMFFNLQDATRCYEISLKMDPKNVNVLNNLATVYDSLKQYKKAVKMYHRALKIEPRSALVLKNLGTDLMAQHKYEKGWEIYKAALVVDPQIFDRSSGPRVENPASVQDRGAMNYYMAKGCARAGKNDRAIEYLRSALSEGFTNPRKIAADQEFVALYGLPAFDQLIARQEKQ